MNATTVAVDLAKSVFELVAADEQWRIVARLRFTRTPTYGVSLALREESI